MSNWVACVARVAWHQVYTVGPDYAHAEARKSPALDGKVERDSEGKEVRYPVILNAREKLIAWKVCLAFKVGAWETSLKLLPVCLFYRAVSWHPDIKQKDRVDTLLFKGGHTG